MIIFKLILSAIPLLGISAYLGKKDVPVFYIPIISLSILIFSLYIFALFDHLLIGWYAFVFIGAMLFTLNFKALKHQILKTVSVKNISLLLYLIPILVVLNSIPNNFQLSYWDEFADWGMSIKYMFSEDRLYSFWREGYFSYGHYPPAQQLLQYYFLKFFGWSEICLIWIELILLLLIQLSFFGTQKKNYIFGSLMYCASFAAPSYFHFFYNNIYVDLFIALYFSSIFLFLINSRSSTLDNLVVCLMLFILVQIKQIGLIFALILLTTYFAKIFVSYCRISNFTLIFETIFTRGQKKNGDDPIPFIYFIGASFSVLISYYSWSIFKKINGVVSNKSETIPALIKFFENPIADRLRDTVHLFIIRLSESSFAIGIKFYYIIIFLILLGTFLSLIINQRKKISDFLMLLVIGFGSIAYFLFVLFAYILFFSYEEGIVLSGFERYTAIYFIGWVMILLGYVIQKTLSSILGKVLSVVISVTLLAIIPPKDFYSIISKITLNQGVMRDREKVNAIIEQLRYIPKNSKIFFVAQGYGGFIHRVFQYSASPMHVSSGCHSFGEKYHLEDSDTCNINLESELKSYDFVALYYGDKQFWEQNKALFPQNFTPVETGLFKITVNSENGRIVLNPYDPN